MTKNEENPQPEVDVVGAGVLLRQARQEKGLTQVEVARQLNLRLAVIESIDGEHNGAGVEPTFLRGYVKAYAKLVGLNEATVLAAFDKQNGPFTYGTAPMQSFSKKTRQQANDTWLKRISWLVLVGLIASLVFWWWQDNQNRSAISNDVRQSELERPELTPSGEPAPTLPASNEASLAESEQGDAQSSTPSAAPLTAPEQEAVDQHVLDALAPDENTEQIAQETVDRADATATSDANPELITLSFTGDCWIQVTDSTGKVLSSGVKKANQSLELEGKPPFSMVLGVPQAANVVYMNKSIDLSAFKAGRTARLTVPKPD